MKQTELAWAAGFIDGEGHFRLHKTKGRKPTGRIYGQPVLTIAQVDRKVLDRVVSILGGTVYGPFKTTNIKWRPSYRYVLWGTNNINRVVRLLTPWLGKIKLTQAEQALADGQSIISRPKLKSGPTPKISSCHPNRKHGARGLCEKCYAADYYRRTIGKK